MAIAVQFNLKAYIVDIVGAYLNRKLKEEIYMELPPATMTAPMTYGNLNTHFTDSNSPAWSGMRNSMLHLSNSATNNFADQ